VTNLYTDQGDPYRMDYSDGTPSVTFTNYNRSGQPLTIIDAAGQRTLAYDYASRQVADYGVSGLFSGITVSNHFNGLYGRDYLEVQGVSPVLHHDYGYDSYGRMQGVTNGSYRAEYAYLPSTDRLQTTTCKSNSTAVLTTTRSWEYGMRLKAIANATNGATVCSHAYLYDAVQRRTQATLEDGSMWKYAYNDRNELVSAGRFWSDWLPVTGQQFQYGYDNIGNRTTSASGGDVNGASLRTATYTANELNQYTSITTPGYEDILGVALATNSVTVNSGGTDRKIVKGSRAF
jgi:hypothetical protein